MTPGEIMRDLARDDIFPKAAMAAARAKRDQMAPVFIDLIARLSRQRIHDMEPDDMKALIPIFHMLGEWREPSAYRPLVQLLRRSTHALDHLLGDAVTETSFRVIAGTFDGNLQPIFELLEDVKADDFARSSLFDSLVVIAQLHPGQRPAIEEYLRTFRQRCPKAETDVLVGWMDAIAALGIPEMSQPVRDMFDHGLIPKEFCDFEHFLEDYEATIKANGTTAMRRYQNALITDAIDELSKWHSYSEEFFAEQKRLKADHLLRVSPWTEAFVNAADKVGRNDPCPCGSGKKFKKCCLH